MNDRKWVYVTLMNVKHGRKFRDAMHDCDMVHPDDVRMRNAENYCTVHVLYGRDREWARSLSFRNPLGHSIANGEMRWCVLMVAVSLLLPSGGLGQTHMGKLVDGGPGRGPN